jgi:hypothetical protein
VKTLWSIAASILLLVGVALVPPARAADGPGGTVGATLLDVAPDTVGLSFRLRVDEPGLGTKIVFIALRTVTPDVPGGVGHGTIDLDVFNHWVGYEDDLGHAGWPEQGDPHPGEPSLWLRNVDYGGWGSVGLMPLSEASRRLFPRQTAGIDRVGGQRADLTSIAAIHQGSILGREVRVTLVRQPLMTRGAELDWGHRFTWEGDATPTLPAGEYWPWLATIETEGGPTAYFLFLLDELRGRYVIPNGGVSVRTEFFFRPDVPENRDGAFQLFVWDVHTLRESDDGEWRRHTRWDYGEDQTVGGLARGYGFRVARDRSGSALEVGYGLGDYARLGDVLETP